MRDTRTQREDSVKDASLGFFLSPGKGRQECHALAVASPKKPVSVPAGSSSAFPGRIGVILGPGDQETTILLAPAIPKITWWLVFLWTIGVTSLLLTTLANAQESKIEGYATWYSRSSAMKEQPHYRAITASGEPFSDNANTAAMWNVPFGTSIKVTNLENNKSVIVKINDRGPSKKLLKQGRIIDLSKRAFSRISDLKRGIIAVKTEVVSHARNVQNLSAMRNYDGQRKQTLPPMLEEPI